MPISPQIQLERRARLLSRTREMIKQVGVDDLNVRELAKHCGVSVPTLYNQFENKDKLVLAAADEVFLWHYERLPAVTEKSGIASLFTTAESTAELMLSNVELTHIMVRSVHTIPNSRGVAMHRYAAILQIMKQRGEILPWVDTEVAGKRLYHRLRGAAVEWSQQLLQSSQLVETRRYELCLTLLAICDPSLRDKIEPTLLEAMQAIAHR